MHQNIKVWEANRKELVIKLELNIVVLKSLGPLTTQFYNSNDPTSEQFEQLQQQ